MNYSIALKKQTYGDATALFVLCVVWIPAQAMTALWRWRPRVALEDDELNNFAEFLAAEDASIFKCNFYNEDI